MSNKMELSYFLLVPNLLIRQINIPPYFINTNCSRDSGFTPASQAGFEISHVTPAKTNNNKYDYFRDIAPCTGCYINVLTQWQNCTQTAHSHTHTHTIVFIPTIPSCPFETEDGLNHYVMSYFLSPGTKTPRHPFSLSDLQFLLRDMKAVFTLSRSLEDAHKHRK